MSSLGEFRAKLARTRLSEHKSMNISVVLGPEINGTEDNAILDSKEDISLLRRVHVQRTAVNYCSIMQSLHSEGISKPNTAERTCVSVCQRKEQGYRAFPGRMS